MQFEANQQQLQFAQNSVDSTILQQQLQYGMQSNMTAEMLLYPPKQQPTQMNRSYNLNFTEKNIQSILTATDAKITGHATPTHDTENLLSAINVDQMGTEVNHNAISDCWTFTLILDAIPASNRITNNGSRLMCSGYFIASEPMSMEQLAQPEPILNPNAICVITHSVYLQKTNEVNNSGAVERVNVSKCGDHVANSTGAFLNGNMYMSTPNDLAVAVQNAGSTGVGLGESALANVIGDSVRMPELLKNPMYQLNNLITTTAGARNDNDVFVSSFINDSASVLDPAENFLDQLTSNLPGHEILRDVVGLDISQPVTLNELDIITKGRLHCKPIPMNTNQWGIKPQEVISQDIIMSSMITNAVSSICNGRQIANVAFQYNSYGGVNANSGLFQIEQVPAPATMSIVTPQVMEWTLKSLEQELKSTLFPVLQAGGGDFDLIVLFDVFGETLVDFHYKDISDQMVGFVETPNRFSSMLNPNLANENTMCHNVGSMSNLIAAVSSADMVNTSFDTSAYGYQN